MASKKQSEMQTIVGTLREVAPSTWKLRAEGKRRVDVHYVGNRKILEAVRQDRALVQAANVAELPGVLEPVLAMPDMHQGYGFPIGGVAAFHASSGVVSPGRVGYDINCGVRLLSTGLQAADVSAKDLQKILAQIAKTIPAGMGQDGVCPRLNDEELDQLFQDGAKWALGRGFDFDDDLSVLEDTGRMSGAEPAAVSKVSRDRGRKQLGSLGSGNHFVEVSRVEQVFDRRVADAFGLSRAQLVVLIHTGSRGLGYQVCTDAVEAALEAGSRYGIELPDRDLACVPINSSEGKKYLAGMAAAANFAFANRQVLAHTASRAIQSVIASAKVRTIYDACHNIAKFEEFYIDKKLVRACVHRKGATRAYPAGHVSVPPRYRSVGQPVIVPGDMGRASYVLVPTERALKETFASSCHGAGREMSRTQARKRAEGRKIASELTAQGVLVQSRTPKSLGEEMPEAYKDISDVVDSICDAQIAKAVVRLKPVAVYKG